MTKRAKPPTPGRIRRVLRDTFGIDRLRDAQHEVLARVLAGRSTLALMPTGAGKSLCYQLPAVLMEGRTVVVSPLIALMKDQCDSLQDRGVAAVSLHSGLAAAEAAQAHGAIADGSARIVFTTPEQLQQEDFRAAVRARPVELVVIDEAHCITQWGMDFRPAFSGIAESIASLGRPAVLALTATATPAVAADITRALGIPMAGVVRTGSHRPNLHYRVENFSRDADKLERLIDLVRSSEGAGIVYAATVKSAEAVHEALVAADESTALYHGRLSARQRHATQDDFMEGRTRVMVATNAFGLGIDKPDIRFVVHHQMPGRIDAYYQESGRAGRDGETATCTLLHVAGDRNVQQFFLANRYPDLADFKAAAAAMAQAEGGGESESTSDEDRAGGRSRKRAVAAQLLRSEGLLAARVGRDADGPAIDALVQRCHEKSLDDRHMLERMVAYAQSGLCRWRQLLEGLGEPDPVEHCGNCDNCARRASLASASPEPSDEMAALGETVEGPAFDVGERVRTRRHGVAEVVASDGASVTLRFDTGETRSFQPQFVVPLKRRRAAASTTRVLAAA